MPDSVLIDTLDIMDLHMLTCGEDSVIAEGATIIGHTFKNGYLIFGPVSGVRGQGCTVDDCNTGLNSVQAVGVVVSEASVHFADSCLFMWHGFFVWQRSFGRIHEADTTSFQILSSPTC